MTTELAPAPLEPAAPRPRRWLVFVSLAWGIVLAAGIGWALLHGGPTAREQTTVAQARPVVDRATAEIATAASTDGLAVVSVSGFERVGNCMVTVVRPGERYQRVVTAFVAPGTERALLERVAQRLPASYKASVSRGSVPRFSADAGMWVRLTGSPVNPGQVRFVADTGECRPAGDLAAIDEGSGDRSAAATALGKLGVSAASWSTYRAACPDGGYVSTVEATGVDGDRPEPLDEALRGAGYTVVAEPDAYAYIDGTTGVTVRIGDKHVVVTATTPCGQ